MDINLVAVILSALAAFFLGFIWYTVVFVKPWQKEIGMKEITPGEPMPGLGKQLIGSFILEFVMAFILAYFLGTKAGAMLGLTIGLLTGFLVSCTFGVNYFFEGKTLKLWLINASYNVVVFAVMGMIIGLM